jgi:hypothetical protein
MGFYLLTLSVLCVWRITHLLHAEDGPWNLFVHLRRLAGNSVAGKIMDCFYCLSLWVALPIALLVPGTRLERLLWWPALSAGAILLERISSFGTADVPVRYVEDPPEDTPLQDEGEITCPVAER